MNGHGVRVSGSIEEPHVIRLRNDRFWIPPKNLVVVARPSKWGNPFSHLDNSSASYRVATREESIAMHAEWIVRQTDLLNDIHELTGKVLGCWCKPKACHADILLRLANPELIEPEQMNLGF